MEQLDYTTNSTKMQYKHLSHSERIKIQELYKIGNSIYAIAKKISRDYNTVKKELNNYGKLNQPSISNRRCGVKKFNYSANKAQKLRNQKYVKPRYYKKFEHFMAYFHKNFHVKMTLEEIRYKYIKEFKNFAVPCLKTLYNWAHRKIIQLSFGCIPLKKQSVNNRSEKIEGRKSISLREQLFGFKQSDYSMRGHYEIDTIYNGDKMGGLLTFNERCSRKLYAVKIKDRKARTINRALRRLINKIGAHNILSITSDNGSEFAYSAVIENSYNIMWFYCDPYSSWQRGQNERLNRDIRVFYPKGTLFNNISDEKIKQTIEYINNKSRRIFDGQSANEYALKLSKINMQSHNTENEKKIYSNDILYIA
jgi:IS30 family transposase